MRWPLARRQKGEAAHTSDRELVRAACAGDQAAVERFLERLACVPAMVRTKHRRMGSPLTEDELEDVQQETFAALWTKLSSFAGRSTFETWAYGFCVNELLKGIQRKRRRSEPVEEIEALTEPVTVDPHKVAALEYEHVHLSLERLGPPGSEVVRLKHFAELTFDEIGAELDISPNTAKTLYYRGLKKLREFLQPIHREEV